MFTVPTIKTLFFRILELGCRITVTRSTCTLISGKDPKLTAIEKDTKSKR